ncbi:MAG: efflux RND transporter periplasmic adaptor subunit [Candidatus Riflebacteria bacterium]|nr:efflux RND transporter periplasmic adaptor subunit [Candidatus Riflebacteria bacterium]
MINQNVRSVFLLYYFISLSIFSPVSAVFAENICASDSERTARLGEITGELMANRKVALAFKVPGKIKEMLFNMGDQVSTDQPLARLDSRDFEINRKQAQAGLEAIRAKLKQQENGARPQEKKQAEELVRQAKAAHENAGSDLKRTQELFTAGGASKQALDAAIARATIAETQYRSALQQKDLVLEGPRQEDRDATAAQARQQEAVIDNTSLQIEYCTLSAPFSGLISQRHADEGAYVTTSIPVFTIVENDPIIAAIDVPENFSSCFKQGLSAELKVFAFPGETYQGRVIRIAPVIDPKNRTLRVELAVTNKDLKLKPGMFVTARFFNNDEQAEEAIVK